MEIAYLGEAEGGLKLLEAGIPMAAAGTTASRGPAVAELRRRLARVGVGLLARPDLRRAEATRSLTGAGASLLVCYLWDRMVPRTVLEAFPEGAVGYRPALLPRHRGPAPCFWTLWEGDERAGVSIYRLDHGVDTGPLIAQSSFPVHEGCTAGYLASLTDPLGLDMLTDVVERWRETGLAPVERAQGEAGATLAPSPEHDLLTIRWGWPARRIARLVFAASPSPGARWEMVGGETLRVIAARARDGPSRAGLEPGRATRAEGGVVVGTGEGALLLEAGHVGDGPLLEGSALALAVVDGRQR